MTTEAMIITAVKEEALVVPIEAVSVVSGEKTVLVESYMGFNETRKVETGIYSNTMIEITSGLEEGEKVGLPQAAKDLFQLIPGLPVQGDQSWLDEAEKVYAEEDKLQDEYGEE